MTVLTLVAAQPEPKSRHVHKIDVLKQVMMDKSHSIQSIGPDVPPVREGKVMYLTSSKARANHHRHPCREDSLRIISLESCHQLASKTSFTNGHNKESLSPAQTISHAETTKLKGQQSLRSPHSSQAASVLIDK